MLQTKRTSAGKDPRGGTCPLRLESLNRHMYLYFLDNILKMLMGIYLLGCFFDNILKFLWTYIYRDKCLYMYVNDVIVETIMFLELDANRAWLCGQVRERNF